MLRQFRSIRAELERRPKRGGLIVVTGRTVHGGAYRRRADCYWARRLRLAEWFRKVSRIWIQRTEIG